MKHTSLGLVLMAVCAVLSSACGAEPARPVEPQKDPDTSALGEFTQRASEYADWRRRLAGPFGAIDETKSPQELATREADLAAAIRKERASAKQGDIFTPAAAPVLKARIKAIYKSSPEVRDTRRDAEIELPDFVPEVNMLYPTTFPLATFPPTLLTVLPELPKELEYRIVTHNLILRDVEANTIIDVLPNAIP